MGNIILTGFMGTGKTSVGVEVAERLGYGFCDLDSLIVDHAGLSITEIFRLHGEPYFRALEEEMVEKVAAMERVVVATGGGAVKSANSRRLLRSCGVVVNLTAGAEEIGARLTGDESRPLFLEDRSLEKIESMLREREPFYADADVRIDTSGKRVEDVVQEIVLYLEGKAHIENANG